MHFDSYYKAFLSSFFNKNDQVHINYDVIYDGIFLGIIWIKYIIRFLYHKVFKSSSPHRNCWPQLSAVRRQLKTIISKTRHSLGWRWRWIGEDNKEENESSPWVSNNKFFLYLIRKTTVTKILVAISLLTLYFESINSIFWVIVIFLVINCDN